MADLSYQPADLAHVETVARALRADDLAELNASSLDGPLLALEKSVRMSSHAWAALEDGEPIAMWGVVPFSLLSGRGCPWFMATDRANSYSKRFLSDGRRFFAQMLDAYPALENFVDARYQKSVDWLGRLGFTIEPPVPFGVMGLPFHRFWTERHV